MKIKTYVVLNPRAVVLLTMVTVAVTALSVFGLGHKSVLVETQRTVGFLSLTLFLFLFKGLYKGYRLQKDQVRIREWEPLKARDLRLDFTGEFIEIGGDLASAVLSVILSVLLWIFASTVLSFLFWLLANMLWGMVFLLFSACYWLLYRALRQVFIRGRRCRGNWVLSCGFSLYYTFLYTGWIYLMLVAGKRLVHWSTMIK